MGVSGSTRIGVGVSDDLVVVRHHGSVSGSRQDSMDGMDLREQSERRITAAE